MRSTPHGITLRNHYLPDTASFWKAFASKKPTFTALTQDVKNEMPKHWESWTTLQVYTKYNIVVHYLFLSNFQPESILGIACCSKSVCGSGAGKAGRSRRVPSLRNLGNGPPMGLSQEEFPPWDFKKLKNRKGTSFSHWKMHQECPNFQKFAHFARNSF